MMAQLDLVTDRPRAAALIVTTKEFICYNVLAVVASPGVHSLQQKQFRPRRRAQFPDPSYSQARRLITAPSRQIILATWQGTVRRHIKVIIRSPLPSPLGSIRAGLERGCEEVAAVQQFGVLWAHGRVRSNGRGRGRGGRYCRHRSGCGGRERSTSSRGRGFTSKLAIYIQKSTSAHGQWWRRHQHTNTRRIFHWQRRQRGG